MKRIKNIYTKIKDKSKAFYTKHQKLIKRVGNRILLTICLPLIVWEFVLALFLILYQWSNKTTKSIDDVK